VSERPDLILVTETWDGLGLAMLAERQGASVLVAYDSRALEKKDAAAAHQAGEGIIERMKLAEAIKTYTGQGAIWLFDSNSFPEQADALRKKGEAVLGTGALSAKMEKDRHFAAKLAEDVGFDLTDTEEFSDTTEAIVYLEAHEDTAYVCKAQGGDADLTFVPQYDDPAPLANRMVRGYLAALEDHPGQPTSFILQKKVDGGTEVNVDLWVHEGQPLVAFVDLEAKRRHTGERGELIGCAGDYLFQIPVTSPLVKKTAGRFLGHKEFRNYTGSIDANVILKGGKVFWLEACDRLGYNAAPTLFYGLARAPMLRILEGWLAGRPLGPTFGRGYAASLSLLTSEHELGFPVLGPRSALTRFCPYSVREGPDGILVMVGGGKAWYNVGCTVATAATAEAAGKMCLRLAQQIIFPNKSLRTDLADHDLPTLPLARLRQLQAMGLMGGTSGSLR